MQEIREKITEIDNKIIKLLEQRFELCKRVGEIKRANRLPILDEKREQEILTGIEDAADNYGEETKAIFVEIMHQAKIIE